ncbi:MAG: hypothetical protein HND52_13710 [Ignavibacteriae bacterium]|nr:hypothetical protein [Ignavibacteriota bacterium]NOG99010.1 hypothetical protein [Ignavibacteriota bacterium]
MSNLNLQKAKSIANQYFTLLIEKHRALGYKVEVVEQTQNSDTSYYIKFTNSQNLSKLYEIQNIN